MVVLAGAVIGTAPPRDKEEMGHFVAEPIPLPRPNTPSVNRLTPSRTWFLPDLDYSR